jgi:cytochrome c oxidase assembly factor 3, fungi type
MFRFRWIKHRYIVAVSTLSDVPLININTAGTCALPQRANTYRHPPRSNERRLHLPANRKAVLQAQKLCKEHIHFYPMSAHRNVGQVMSPGLKRARQPYLLRNVVTGLVITAFVGGVYAYSINAVKQDVFDDIDEEARALGALPATTSENTPSRAGSTTVLPAGGTGREKAITLTTPITPAAMDPSVSAARSEGLPRGVLAAILDRHYPAALDPTSKTLVWGAPPVDNIGRIKRH